LFHRQDQIHNGVTQRELYPRLLLLPLPLFCSLVLSFIAIK
jgi:hypothetical protein